jgi:CRISPR-associated protein Cas2
MHYVIAYDISEDSKRNRVARFLEGWGRRVQKSVFECGLGPEDLAEVLAGLREMLDANEDRCHIYGICTECLRRRTVVGADLEPGWEETAIV